MRAIIAVGVAGLSIVNRIPRSAEKTSTAGGVKGGLEAPAETDDSQLPEDGRAISMIDKTIIENVEGDGQKVVLQTQKTSHRKFRRMSLR